MTDTPGSFARSRATGLAGPRVAVALPVALAVALVLLLGAGLLLRERAAAAGLAASPDTGPVLAGAELPADGSAGDPTVRLSPAAADHPRAAEVRDLVQRYVDARARKDFAAWTAVVTPTSTTDEAAFARQTRTERIGSVVVRRIDPVGDGELVMPTGMVTTQDPADAPPDVAVPRLCWQLSLVVLAGTPGRLVEPRAGSALRTPC